MLTLHELMQLSDEEMTQAFCDDKVEPMWRYMFINRIDTSKYLHSRDEMDMATLELLLPHVGLESLILSPADIDFELAIAILNRTDRISTAGIGAAAICKRYRLPKKILKSIAGIVSRDVMFKYQDWHNPDTIPNETFLKYQTTLPKDTMKLLGLTDSMVDLKIAHIYPYEEVFTRMAKEPHLFYDKDGQVVTAEHIREVYDNNPAICDLLDPNKIVL